MWVTVTKKFKDKHTGEIHNVGDKLNISKKRKDEILSKGDFVKETVKDDNNENSAE